MGNCCHPPIIDAKSSSQNVQLLQHKLELFVSDRFNMIDVYVRQKSQDPIKPGCHYKICYRNSVTGDTWKDCPQRDILHVHGAVGRLCTITDLEPQTTYDIRAELISDSSGSVEANSRQAVATTSNPMVAKKCYKCTYDFVKRVGHEISAKVGDILEEDPTRTPSVGYEDFVYVKNLATEKVGFVPKVTIARYPEGDQPKVLTEQDCFFTANRRKAMVWMMRPDVDKGRFMLRPASEASFFALSVRFGVDKDEIAIVEHYRVYVMSDGYGCYVNAPAKTFEDIGKLVQYYRRNSLSPDRTVLLTHPFPRNPAPPTLDEIKIPNSKVRVLEELGRGNFGVVYKAKLMDKLDVAVKILLNNISANSGNGLLPRPSVTDSAALLQEAEAMAALFHDNLVRIIGVCVDIEPYMIVSELMNRGSLLKHLNDDAAVVGMQLEDVVFILSQVACGMAYLEDRNVVHRDLRAANVLVHDENNKLEIKIADFGLTRILSEYEEIYRSSPDAVVPIRWTAPEAALESLFSIKSDVWSFGILAVEVLTLGSLPYKEKPNTEIFKFLKSGGRITAKEVVANKRKVAVPASYSKKQTVNDEQLCPETLFYEISLCWKADPQDRPTFAALFDFLENYESASNYMS